MISMIASLHELRSSPHQNQGLTGWIIVVWHVVVAIEGDTDLTALDGLELLAVDLDGVCVGDDFAVSDNVRLGCGVATRAEEGVDGVGVDWVGGANAIGRATGSEDTTTVSEDSNTPRLVESEPVLDAVAEVLEANLEKRAKNGQGVFAGDARPARDHRHTLA